MSTEFFQAMELIEKKSQTIKFLEGSHSELYDKYYEEATLILSGLESMEIKIKADLKRKATRNPNPKKKKKNEK